MATHYKSKWLASALALTLGLLGAHAWYLQRPRAIWWTMASIGLMLAASQAQVWWDNLWFHLLLIPCFAGVLESVVLALQDPRRFDHLYNHGQQGANRLGWPSVLLAVAGTLFGGTVLLYWLAMVVMSVYRHMGWLEAGVY